MVQTEGTGNAAWNETQAWSNGWTDDSTFFSAGAEAYQGGKFACFSSANDKATTCDIYSGANSRIEWNGNVSGDNITIKFYKERQATLGYVLNGVEQLVTDEVGWGSPTTKNLGNGVLTQLFAENNAGTSAGFFSVVVDGKVLVDPTNIYSVVSTDADNSKMVVDGGAWSDDSDAIVYSDGGDDDELYRFSWKDTFAAGALNYTGNAWVREDPATFTLPDSVSGTLTIYAGGTGSSEGTVTANINGVTSTVTFNNSSEKDTFTNFTVTGGESIVFTPTGIGAFIVAMDLDGSRLVDPEGQTQVTGLTYQGTGDYVSHTANTLELTNAADRWCVD